MIDGRMPLIRRKNRVTFLFLTEPRARLEVFHEDGKNSGVVPYARRRPGVWLVVRSPIAAGRSGGELIELSGVAAVHRCPDHCSSQLCRRRATQGPDLWCD